MKSRFFTDTQGLDAMPHTGGKVNVCLLLDRRAYERALCEAQRLHLTSGEYIEGLILRQPRQPKRITVCGTKAPLPSGSPSQRIPPAPPGR